MKQQVTEYKKKTNSGRKKEKRWFIHACVLGCAKCQPDIHGEHALYGISGENKVYLEKASPLLIRLSTYPLKHSCEWLAL